VSVANGILLVDGTVVLPISAANNPAFPTEKVIAVTLGATTTYPPTSDISGGASVPCSRFATRP
jgi:hypothetical protein